MGLKVVKHTADELVIRSTPLLQWFIGGAVILIGVLVMGWIAGGSAFECDRGAEECVLERNWMLRGDQWMSYRLEELQGVEMASRRDPDDGTITYRVEFLIGDHAVGLTENWSNVGQMKREQAVRDVQAFLDDPDQERVRVEESTHLGGVLGGGIFFVMGLLVAGFGVFRRFRFSIPEDRLSVRTFGPMGQRYREDFPLRDVKWMKDEAIHPEFATPVRRLELRGGRSVQLTGFLIGAGSGQRVLEALNAFLLYRPQEMRADREDDDWERETTGP